MPTVTSRDGTTIDVWARFGIQSPADTTMPFEAAWGVEGAVCVAHPRYGCRKIYEVKVKGVPPAEQIARLRRGILIDGQRTSPSRIQRLGTTVRGGEEGNSWWEVELTEGRSRQIREMFFRIEHPVQKLRRVQIGLGEEEKGMRRLVEGSCDEVFSIPMPGNFESLNVSAAAAVVLFEIVRQRT